MRHYITFIFIHKNQLQNIFIILVKPKILKNGIKAEKVIEGLYIKSLKKSLHLHHITFKNLVVMNFQFGILVIEKTKIKVKVKIKIKKVKTKIKKIKIKRVKTKRVKTKRVKIK